MDEQTVFLQALEQDTPEKRAKWLDDVCGRETPFRQRIDALLMQHEQAKSFLEKPLVEPEVTAGCGPGDEPIAGSRRAGLDPPLEPDGPVVFGNHSVLKSLGNPTLELPRVVLREPTEEGMDPVVNPASPEIPNRHADSRYQFLGEIARGGMGVIIKGRDTDLGRDLAIKVLLETHKDKPDIIQRFVEEAQIGGQLQHPGIAPVYELGQFSDRRPCFSMKLVKGQTLSALLAQRRDPSHDRARFLGIFEQVCQTMAYAHSRGVIHRDLKPANIMVGTFGEVQVMDWGLAKVLAAGGIADERNEQKSSHQKSVIQTLRSLGSDTPPSLGSQTQMGSVMGTPAYMSPEQALGEIDRLDERSDVFGLGAILCAILTGEPPYVAKDGTDVFRQAARGKLKECFARLDACGADNDLVDLAKRCLEVEPDDRPRDAGVLAERVSRYLESVETRLRETELQRAAQTARAEEERKRRRVTMSLAASVLLLVGVAGAGWVYLDKQNSLQEQQRLQRQVTAEQRVNNSLNDADHNEQSASTVVADSQHDQETALSRKLQLLDKAVVSAEQAVESARQEDVSSSLRRHADQRLSELRSRRSIVEAEAARATTEREFREELDQIRLAQANQGDTVAPFGVFFDLGSADHRYEDAFRQARLDVLTMSVPDAVALIQSSPMRDRIIAALDDWARSLPAPTSTDDAFVRAMSGRHFAAAAESGRRLVRQTPWDTELWLRLAPILALKENKAEYGRFCQRMTRQFAATNDVQTAERTCKACLLLPDAIELAQLPRNKLATSLDEGATPDWLLPWAWFARALLAYRSGDAKSSLQYGRTSDEHNRDHNDFVLALNLALRALAQHQLGHLDESRSDLENGAVIINRLLKEGYHPSNYHDLMITHILLLEASALLDSNANRKPLESERYLSDVPEVTPTRPTRRETLTLIADQSDSNPWRRKIRDALNGGDVIKVEELATGHEVTQQLPELIAWLGATLREAGEFDTSVMVLRECQRAHPGDFWLNFELAVSLREKGVAAEAIQFARAALAVRPESLEALIALGEALDAAGSADAQHVYQAILPRIPLDFKNGEALYHRGLTLMNSGKMDNVVARLREYCDVCPADPRGHMILAMALTHYADKQDDVLVELQKVADLKPIDAKIYAWFPYGVGSNMLSRGNVGQARIAFRIANEFAPPDIVAMEILDTYAEAGNWAAAVDTGRQFMHGNLDDSGGWIRVAPLLVLSGDEESYRQHCRRMVERFANAEDLEDVDRICKVCCLMPDAMDLAQLPVDRLAQSLDEKGAAPASFLPRGWTTRALVAYRGGDAEKALKYVDTARHYHPNAHSHALVLVVRALARLKLGRVEQARLDVDNASNAIANLPGYKKTANHELLMAQILWREAKTNLDAYAVK